MIKTTHIVSAILAFGLSPPALAGTDHKMTELFAREPCGAVVATIDTDTSWPGVKTGLEGAGWMAMAFGYLLGAEAALGPMHTSDQTTLERFRAECGRHPNKTGLAIMRSLPLEPAK